ncbi:Colicin/pyocin immunity protein [Pseudomonas amygdali pv. morsprunorum]|uniref:bacteriocin immunity protein n=1 Tax=Pseudomonas amygdali TaxID=47877 RepID=UPI0006B900B2|nr:bacteriocin immunity protein [Pseudomonas amygdali]KPC57202.1 Colicin/pyocin immunity protein [Pseudomonas amygdali pv. morsprunorum]PPS33555.1 bacteriocin immunity protein [Pseudomonas amygdali pv. morsprunorum]
MNLKSQLSDYTEAEFMEVLNELFNGVSATKENAEEYVISLIDHIAEVTEHPEKSDLLCYPPEGREDSAAGVMKETKEWRAKNGKPGFKD